MWIIENPSLNPVGCPHPRPNPAEGRKDLQLGAFEFEVVTEEELKIWRLSPIFLESVDDGYLVVREVKELPKRRPTLPAALVPDNRYDEQQAKQIALAGRQDIELARINVFKSPDEGVEWVSNVDITYLKTRHRKLLKAVEWYLVEYIPKRNKDQNARLRATRRQIKAIDQLG